MGPLFIRGPGPARAARFFSISFRPHITSPNQFRPLLPTNPFPSFLRSMASAVETAKRLAAIRAVEENFNPAAAFVGIGSGTTVVYVVEAIKERATNPDIRFIPTGSQSRGVIESAGLTAIAFDDLPDDAVVDVAFDGADEVDANLNCIKGGGACLFQEKLVAERANKFVCVADYRKDQARLLTQWPTIPIEVAPISVKAVIHALRSIGSTNPIVRPSLDPNAGPRKTDQDFYIIDAPFPSLLIPADVAAGKGTGLGDGTWEVVALSKRIKAITGVLEVGIFAGLTGPEAQAQGLRGGQKPVAAYFGMADGTVKVRYAKDD